MPPENVLDFLAGLVSAHSDEFPGSVRKTWFEGSHGRSVTQSLVIQLSDGSFCEVSMAKLDHPAGKDAWNKARS